MDKKVIVYEKKEVKYPTLQNKTFRPGTRYPEYCFDEIDIQKNEVYEMVRESLFLAGYDRPHYGDVEWNPLGELIKPGQTVVIKPNLVMHENPVQGDTECLYTHPSVTAAVLDYVVKALSGSGKIIVGDAPMQDCDFDKLIYQSGYFELIKYYKDKQIDIQLIDFREIRSKVVHGVYYNIPNENAAGIIVDLKQNSEFSKYDANYLKRLRITNYDPHELLRHHQEGKHEYSISHIILAADIVINLPKPKTHKKAGVTISLKNMVGTTARKEYLPHHCMGGRESNGDEYLKKSRLKEIQAKMLDKINYESAIKHYRRARILKTVNRGISFFIRFGSDQYREGSWSGNETISKTITDLNKILFYADKEGRMQKEKQRKFLIVADMIVSGEGEGPVRPSRKETGIIAVAEQPVCFDEVIATLMGADILQIPTLQTARKASGEFPIVEDDDRALLVSNNKLWNGKRIEDIEYRLNFRPSSGWKDAFIYRD